MEHNQPLILTIIYSDHYFNITVTNITSVKNKIDSIVMSFKLDLVFCKAVKLL